jgi:hypothetical protein
MFNSKQLGILCIISILSLGSAVHAASGIDGKNITDSKGQESSIQGESRQSSGSDMQKSFGNSNHAFSASEKKDPLNSEVISGKPDFNPGMANGSDLAGGNPTTPIPEPEIYAMLLAGLVLLGFLAYRKKAV